MFPKTLVMDSPCSFMAKFIIALTDENTRLTEEEDIPLKEEVPKPACV